MHENSREAALEDLYRQWDEDPPDALKELKDGARRFVPGDGSLIPKAIIVGEAPGAREDRVGSPFVGPSGEFLDQLLLMAGLHREEVWITNVVKYRPTGNRTPERDEISASLPLLRREVALVAGERRPILVGLGRVACEVLVRGAISVARAHGTWRRLGRHEDWRLFLSYHPSAGLRSKSVREAMLADFAKLGNDMRIIELAERNGRWPAETNT
jgi:uracil-DNA glycosylase